MGFNFRVAAQQIEIDTVAKPVACSYCGGTEFTDEGDNGRVDRIKCQSCDGTMTSDGRAYQPDLIGSPHNHPAQNGDPASGGVPGVWAPVLRREDLDRTAALRHEHPCPDCGGTGEEVNPADPGHECASCDGSGVDPRVASLHTAMPSRRHAPPQGVRFTVEHYAPDSDEARDLDTHMRGYDHHLLRAHLPEREHVGEIEYSTHQERPELAINHMRVDPDHQRRGIASAMQDRLRDLYPDHLFDHGGRSQQGERWWAQYEDPAPHLDVDNPQHLQQVRAGLDGPDQPRLLPVRSVGYRGFVEATPGHEEQTREFERQHFPEDVQHPSQDAHLDNAVGHHARLMTFLNSHIDNHDYWNRHGQLEEVDHNRHGVYATQPYLVAHHIDRYRNDRSSPHEGDPSTATGGYPGNHHPMMVRHEGNLFAVEGHHRVASDMLAARPTKAFIYDADQHGFPEPTHDYMRYESDNPGLAKYANRRVRRCLFEHADPAQAAAHALYNHDDGICVATEAQQPEGDDDMVPTSHEATLRDPELRMHFCATWADVRNKAKRIRAEGGVHIVVSSTDGVGANVQGDTGVYETILSYRPGTFKVSAWQCFLPDAPVTMADGSEKPISEIKPGDMVITHTGAARRVVRAEAKPYDGDLTRIRMAGDHRELVATSEHEVYAANKDYYLDGRQRQVLYQHTGTTTPLLRPQVTWRGIGTLGTGDYVSRTPLEGSAPLSVRVPRPPLRPVTAASGVRGVSFHDNRTTGMQYWVFRVTEGGRDGVPRTSYFKTRDEAVAASNAHYAERSHLDVKIDEELAYWLGWYTAEGFLVRRGYQVGFSLSADEVWVTEVLDDIAWRKFGVRGTVRHLGNKIEYRISHFALHYVASQLVGHGAKTKSLSAQILMLPDHEAERFIQGWLLGDGAVESTGRHSISTVSPTLSLQARELLSRHGYSVSISRAATNPGGLMSTQNGGEIFWVRYQSRRGNVAQFHKDGSVWHRVEATTTEHYSGDVWDIEVEGDHSFRAYGYNVHNCGCAWAAYAFNRSPAFRRFEGRLCSHALALQFEAQARGMFGKTVTEDAQRPSWLRDKARQRYLPDTGEHVLVSASRNDVYPDDHGLDLLRPPVYAFAVTALSRGADPAAALQTMLDVGLGHTAARALLREALADPLSRTAGAHCPDCGSPVPAGAKVCPHCHAVLSDDDPGLHMAAKTGEDAPTHAGLALKAADTGRVLMLQRSHKDEDDPAAGRWEFPGGQIEQHDHNSLHGALREFAEEVGQPVPPGGTLQHVHRSGPYVLHTMVIPSEDAITLSEGRIVPNPDDPKGDAAEQAAWWEPEHAQRNPALREECKSSPWKAIREASRGTTAVFSANDPLGSMPPNDPPAYSENMLPSDQVADQQNPASTGFATSADPGAFQDAGKSTFSLPPLNATMRTAGGAPDYETPGPHVMREDDYDDAAGVHLPIGTHVHVKRFDTHDGQIWGVVDHAHGEAYVDPTKMQRVQHGGPDDGAARWQQSDRPDVGFGTPTQHRHLDWVLGPNAEQRPEQEPSSDWSKPPGDTGYPWGGHQNADEYWHSEKPVHGRDIRERFDPDNPAHHNDPWHHGAPWTRDGLPIRSLNTLHDQPEPALPSTDGSDDDVWDTYVDPAHQHVPLDWTMGRPDPTDAMPSDISPTEMMTPNQVTASVDDIVARFQATAGAKALQGPTDDRSIAEAARAHLSKTALKDFTPSEQAELINEGRGTRARNLGDLRIEGTHYQNIEEALKGYDDPDDVLIV